MLALGCGESGEPTSADGGFVLREPVRVTLRLTGVTREDANGHVRGVDLDGRVSDGTDELGCFQEDWIDSVTGEPGVDNNYGVLVASAENNRPVGPPGEPTIDEYLLAANILVRLEIEGADGGLRVRLGDAAPVWVPVDVGHFQALDRGSIEFVSAELAHPLHDVAVDGLIAPDGALSEVVIAGSIDVEEFVRLAESPVPTSTRTSSGPPSKASLTWSWAATVPARE